MLTIRWGRVVLAGITAEAVPIVVLVAAVAAFGPGEQSEAEIFAARLGRWIGPIGGAVMCFLLAVWVARREGFRPRLHAGLVGLIAAFLDVGLLIASGTAFEWLFVVSNVGRIVAAAIGGVIATQCCRLTKAKRNA